MDNPKYSPNKEIIKANLHGHLLAGFDPWWRKQFGIQGENLAQVVTDKCIEKDLEICAITNDFPKEFQYRSRFSRIFEEARELPEGYKLDRLGINAFVIEKNGNRVFYLDGQSIDVEEDGRKYELLTYGSSEIPRRMSFRDTSAFLKGHGLLGIGEHVFALGHHGAMSEEKLLELWYKGYIDAVEHNGKIALPDSFALFPVEKFRGYTHSKNTDLARVAEEHHIPLVGSDDSDGITHIGTSWTEFDRSKINMNTGDTIVSSLNELIVSNDFETNKGYLNVFSFLRYAGWLLTIKQDMLGLRDKYNQKHNWLNGA